MLLGPVITPFAPVIEQMGACAVMKLTEIKLLTDLQCEHKALFYLLMPKGNSMVDWL